MVISLAPRMAKVVHSWLWRHSFSFNINMVFQKGLMEDLTQELRYMITLVYAVVLVYALGISDAMVIVFSVANPLHPPNRYFLTKCINGANDKLILGEVPLESVFRYFYPTDRGTHKE